MILRSLRFVFALCVSGLATFAAAQPIRIGFIAPLTGGSADFGNSARIGAQLAVEEINQVGGFLGRPFELVVRDDQGTPDVGRRIAEELVAGPAKVDFTIGYCNTGVAMKSIDVFQSHKHLLMVPCSQGTAVTRRYPPRESYIFRVAPSDAINSKFLIAELVDRRKLRKVAVFADETGYGEGGLKDLTAELKARGLAPAYVARFPLGVTSLVTQMREAKAQGVDSIVVYAVGPEQAVAAKSRVEAGLAVPLMAPWPLSFGSVLDRAGAGTLEGTMMVQTVISDTMNERRMSFLARYFKHTSETRIGSLMAAAQAYDSVHLMLWAMFSTKGDTRSDLLKNALEHLDRPYPGVITSYVMPFTPDDHDAFTVNMLFLGVWRKGQIEYFYPEDAKRSGFIRRKTQ